MAVQLPLISPIGKFSFLTDTETYVYDYYSRLESAYKPFLSFDYTAYLVNGIFGDVISKMDLILKDCPQLGDLTADRDVILINCPNHGKVRAGRDAWKLGERTVNEISKIRAQRDIYFEVPKSSKKITYKKCIINEPLKIPFQTLELIDCTVTAAILFENESGKDFCGTLILRGQTEILGLSTINATIEDHRSL